MAASGMDNAMADIRLLPAHNMAMSNSIGFVNYFRNVLLKRRIDYDIKQRAMI